VKLRVIPNCKMHSNWERVSAKTMNIEDYRKYCLSLGEDLKAQHDCIGNPYNESPKHWIGINPKTAPDDLLQELTRNSYEIVKEKYTKKRKN